MRLVRRAVKGDIQWRYFSRLESDGVASDATLLSLQITSFALSVAHVVSSDDRAALDDETEVSMLLMLLLLLLLCLSPLLFAVQQSDNNRLWRYSTHGMDFVIGWSYLTENEYI